MNDVEVIEADEKGLAYAELDAHQIRELMRLSKEAFLELFLAEEMKEGTGVPDFHLLVFNRFTDLTHRKDVAALPREHAKTTLLRLAVVYLIYFSPVQFFIYLSSAHHLAVPSLESIWERLHSDLAVDVFGAPVVFKERLSEGYCTFSVTAYDEEGKPYDKFCILRALGARQSLRGMNIHNLRPEYVACDDIEDEEHVKTEEGYQKLKAWFDNTLGRAVSRRKGKSKFAQIGNLIGLRTLLNDNINDPDWRSIRLGILRRNGQPLWPDSFPLDEIKSSLLAAKRRGQLTNWFGELMNMPLNMENALISYEDIFYTPMRHYGDDGISYRSFITIDPAISKKDTADACAIVLHTIDPLGMPQVTEYVHQKGMDPSDMAAAVGELCFKWDCRVVGCESVQLQKVLLSYFEIYFKLIGITDIEFVPIEVGTTWKTARLKTWCAAVKDKSYSIADNDWGVANQLISFDTRKENNDDDLIDSCSMGLYMLDNYHDLIFADRAIEFTANAPPAQQSSTTV